MLHCSIEDLNSEIVLIVSKTVLEDTTLLDRCHKQDFTVIAHRPFVISE